VDLIFLQDVDGMCRTQCPTDESGAHPVCGSDGRTYSSRCLLQLAKCNGHRVKMIHKGRCRGIVQKFLLKFFLSLIFLSKVDAVIRKKAPVGACERF